MAETVTFAFSIGERVRFANLGPSSDDMRPTVVGRMEDRRGRHYDVSFSEAGARKRAWFGESQLANRP